MINIQDNIAKISVGNISIGSAYVGSQLVWEKVSDPGTPITFADADLKALIVGLWGGEDGGTAAASTRLNGTVVRGIAGEITDKQAASIISLPNSVETLATKVFIELPYSYSTTTPVYGFWINSNASTSGGQSRFVNGNNHVYVHLTQNIYTTTSTWRQMPSYWHLYSTNNYITLLDDTYIRNLGNNYFYFNNQQNLKESTYHIGRLKILVDPT